jgi:hypothetical protein
MLRSPHCSASTISTNQKSAQQDCNIQTGSKRRLLHVIKLSCNFFHHSKSEYEKSGKFNAEVPPSSPIFLEKTQQRNNECEETFIGDYEKGSNNFEKKTRLMKSSKVEYKINVACEAERCRLRTHAYKKHNKI